MSLAEKDCIPCRGDVPPLEKDRTEELLKQLNDAWHLNQEGHLEREYKFKDFIGAMKFANQVGDIAEKEGHHPDLHVTWGKCTVEIWTHKISGLTESDFYLAAKADRAMASS